MVLAQVYLVNRAAVPLELIVVDGELDALLTQHQSGAAYLVTCFELPEIMLEQGHWQAGMKSECHT